MLDTYSSLIGLEPIPFSWSCDFYERWATNQPIQIFHRQMPSILILDWWTSRCFCLCLLVYLTSKSHFLSLYLFFSHSWILIPCITLESYFSTILSCTFLHLFELSFKYIQIYVYLVNLYSFLHLHWFTVWTQYKKIINKWYLHLLYWQIECIQWCK